MKKHLKISIYFVTLVITALIVNCNGQSYAEKWENISYAGDSLAYHMLDIYLPNEGSPPYTPIIAVYGSAWFGNNLKDAAYNVLGKVLLDAGFAVVTVNHRSSRDSIFPAQIHDIKASIRYIRAKGTQYQIDTSFIGITGFSSGGHLATLAGTSGNVRDFTVDSEKADLEGNIGSFPGYSSSVEAVVDWFGPTDFTIMDSCGSQMNHNVSDSPESSLIGGPVQDNKDRCMLVNPITYIDPDDPPFLIIHGDADPLVPICQSEKLFKALQKNNVRSTFITVPEGKHGPGVFDENYFEMMTEFFIDEIKKVK